MKKKIQAVTASLTALSTIMGMSFAIPSVVSASSEVETGYVEAALYDFENDSAGTPQGFASKKDSMDEYPEIEGRGKVYRVTAIKQDEAAIKIIDGLSLPENYEIQADIYSETPSAGKSAGIYVMSDDTGANEGSVLAVRPNHDTNQLDVLANANGTLQIESFDSGLTFAAETWYTIRARLEGDSFSLYISDDENEYTVCEDLTSIGGVNISDIRKYAFTAGLRPYGTTCMYDNFRILLPGLIGRYELADTVEATAVTETVSDENASDGGYVSISGAEGDTAAFEITPPGEGEYYVYAGYKASPEYGKAQLKLVRGGFPTTELGEIDMSSDTEEFREVKLADASFAGTDVMQLVLTLGGAAASIDYLRLEEIPEDLFNASKGTYTIREDQPQQTIWGLGVEIQSDSIASGNQGIDDDNYVSVPHDLVQSERERLATEMLSGFRYLRMAGGLYYRGMTEDGKNLTQRWDTQNAELKEMVELSGIEGIDLEYWSPPAYWKSSESLMENKELGLGSLKCFSENYDFENDPDYHGDKQKFLEDFGTAIADDIEYLSENIAPVVQFCLQNEPDQDFLTYPTCFYTKQDYYETFKTIMPIIKERHPDLFVHADSSAGGVNNAGQHGWGKMLREDPETLQYVDGWSFHRIGTSSDEQITSQAKYNSSTEGRPVFNTEFEYLSGSATDDRFMNTAQSIMNWMTFENSPTWYWLHALKPTYNKEASGYSLGFWRPYDDETTTDIEKGHWVYNDKNYNAIAGFLHHMPWDSVRLTVEEPQVLMNNRIMAWKTPDGRRVFAVTNRNTDSDFEFEVDTVREGDFTGYLYTPYERDTVIGTVSGSLLSITVAPQTIQFWVEDEAPVDTGFDINSISLTDNEAVVNIRHAEPDGEAVAIGVYDSEGKLLKAGLEDIASGTDEYTFDISGIEGANTIKAFIFDSDRITPLCKSKSKYFPGAQPKPELKLFYDEPAEEWDNDALPIGNGYMGAMLFGGVTKDTIQFNEETMFSGKPSEPDTEAYTYLEEIRELIREGKLYEAQQVADKDWLKTASYGTTTNFGSYQNFGNVSVSLGGSGNVSDYRRELDLNNAVSTVSYSMDGANYKRTYFASYPERVVAIRYECDKENGYNATITFDKGHTGDVIAAAGDDVLTMSGSLTNLDYEAKLKVIPEGGTVTADGSSLKVSGATSFVILLTASTDYLASSPTYRGKDYKAENENVISKCSSMSFEELMSEHVADYSSLFGRNVLSLNDERSDVPTDQRLSDYKQGKSDTGLEALLYQYGRYMLVSSSREGTLPANLQGVWNNSNDPEWGSMFCYNINLNMNYWCAQNTNLSECHTAEIDFIDSLRESGRESAKAYFDCDGWFTSKKSDIWGFTMPYGESVYGLSVGGSGWLCEDVWEYYNYNRDEDYLREKAYPIMRESAEFYLDYLTENDEGYLVANPSSSPENSFMYNGKKVNLCEGTEYDHRIIEELFTNCLKALDVLGGDEEFRAQLEYALSKLAPSKIGSNGELLEWDQEYTKAEKNHRHLSFIYGIYPSQVYDTREDTEIAEAAKKTLQSRGGNSTAWSVAWKIAVWARYFDSANAYSNVKFFLNTNVNDNLFCVTPFQVDGSLGYTAGVAEMLMQSNYDKEIVLLPALASEWKEGYVKGLRARGDFTVDIYWENGKLTEAVIYGDEGNSGTVEYGGKVIEFTIPSGGSVVLNNASF